MREKFILTVDMSFEHVNVELKRLPRKRLFPYIYSQTAVLIAYWYLIYV